MKKFIKFWTILAGTYFAGRVSLSYLAGGYVGSSSEVWTGVAVVPFFQAALFGCIAQMKGTPTLFQLLKQTLRRYPLLWLMLIVDLALLGTGWFMKGHEWAEFGRPRNFADYYYSIKAVGLGVLLVTTAFRSPRDMRQPLYLSLLGTVFVGIGLEHIWGWIASATAYAACAGVATAAGWKMYGIGRRQAPAAATALNWTGLVLLPPGLIVASNYPHALELSKLLSGVVLSFVVVAMTVMGLGLMSANAPVKEGSPGQ